LPLKVLFNMNLEFLASDPTGRGRLEVTKVKRPSPDGETGAGFVTGGESVLGVVPEQYDEALKSVAAGDEVVPSDPASAVIQ